MTCCKSTMDEHLKKCKEVAEKLPKHPLPSPLYCVCGYSDNDGMF